MNKRGLGSYNVRAYSPPSDGSGPPPNKKAGNVDAAAEMYTTEQKHPDVLKQGAMRNKLFAQANRRTQRQTVQNFQTERMEKNGSNGSADSNSPGMVLGPMNNLQRSDINLIKSPSKDFASPFQPRNQIESVIVSGRKYLPMAKESSSMSNIVIPYKPLKSSRFQFPQDRLQKKSDAGSQSRPESLSSESKTHAAGLSRDGMNETDPAGKDTSQSFEQMRENNGISTLRDGTLYEKLHLLSSQNYLDVSTDTKCIQTARRDVDDSIATDGDNRGKAARSQVQNGADRSINPPRSIIIHVAESDKHPIATNRAINIDQELMLQGIGLERYKQLQQNETEAPPYA